MVFALQQILEVRQLLIFENLEVSLNKALQNKVELEQGAAAVPTELPATHRRAGAGRVNGGGSHTARSASMFLILPIARIGFSPFGQTSTQFMIE